MKKSIMTTLAVGCFTLALCASTPALAKEVTVTGEGSCAKCGLKQASACQVTITSEAGGQDTVYYVAQNDASKTIGQQLCATKQKVKATGEVEMVDGKMQLTPTAIELVKE